MHFGENSATPLPRLAGFYLARPWAREREGLDAMGRLRGDKKDSGVAALSSDRISSETASEGHRQPEIGAEMILAKDEVTDVITRLWHFTA
jgi:hypothetical protein